MRLAPVSLAEQDRQLLCHEDGSLTDCSEKIIGHTRMARFGHAKKLAGAVAWLAAPKSSSLGTGKNICR